jgi:hypothetical protein
VSSGTPRRARCTVAGALLAALALFGAAGASAAEPDGKLVLPDLTALSKHATDSVDVTLDPGLLSLAAGFLNGDDPHDAAVREVIAGVKGIYVKSYSFDRDFAYSLTALDSVRQQLAGPHWQRIVQVHSGKERSSVDIFICQVQGQAHGLAIVAAEPRELTIVNIVGAIDLAKLHKLEGHFGIPKLAPAR